MYIDHIALYTLDLEPLTHFYTTYFGAKAGNDYHNPKTDLRTRFLSFADGTRLELMTRPNLPPGPCSSPRLGYIHLSVAIESRAVLDALTAQLAADGVPIESRPRVTGDGYYESSVLDPDGNTVELVALRF